VAKRQFNQKFFIKWEYAFSKFINFTLISNILGLNSSSLQTEQYKDAILKGDRGVLAKAITLAESSRSEDQLRAGELLELLLPHAGNSLRIGITGAPGAGKSTFIEAFGKMLLESGKKIAVLTIDPTSQRTQGSILGDKTRMPDLARHPRAFIRPSPSRHTLGGVAASTRESIVLCEAAGFDMIIVETVGTGQSEISIKSMTDFFLLLMLAGSGDELQGIKKGIVEMADAVVITKADGNNEKAARVAQADFQHALHLLPEQPYGWTPKVMTCSALENRGLEAIWSMIADHHQAASRTGLFASNRKAQQAEWFKEYFNDLLFADPAQFPEVVAVQSRLRNLVESQALFARRAARQLLEAYHAAIRSHGA
jgi:LAO/AO transport system kinase